MTEQSVQDINRIQAVIDNRLDPEAIGGPFAGIIGDHPSLYAKSPSIWNPVFKDLGLDAVYLPFDVSAASLPGLLDALRASPQYLGGNVTVPYKVAVMAGLDQVDDAAQRIGAVNTIVRDSEGKLVGYNTDGQGGIDSIVQSQPGSDAPLVKSLQGLNVLLLGAGGAARAMAFNLAMAIGGGQQFIANRTIATAQGLADAVRDVFGNTESIAEDDIEGVAPQIGLVVNCTTRGQAGLRSAPDECSTILEPYSALAPADPPALRLEQFSSQAAFTRTWLEAAFPNIEENNSKSLRMALQFPEKTRFFDAVYAPLETVFLQHARLSGHATMNGKGMNVCQAADGLFNKVCKEYLQTHSMYNPETYQRILNTMYRVW